VTLDRSPLQQRGGGGDAADESQDVQHARRSARTPDQSFGCVRDAAEAGNRMEASRVAEQKISRNADADRRCQPAPRSVGAQKSIPRRARMPWS
jgi:hypothetical protein